MSPRNSRLDYVQCDFSDFLIYIYQLNHSWQIPRRNILFSTFTHAISSPDRSIADRPLPPGVKWTNLKQTNCHAMLMCCHWWAVAKKSSPNLKIFKNVLIEMMCFWLNELYYGQFSKLFKNYVYIFHRRKLHLQYFKNLFLRKVPQKKCDTSLNVIRHMLFRYKFSCLLTNKIF